MTHDSAVPADTVDDSPGYGEDASPALIGPDDVATRTFTETRRGYDPAEVQAFLADVAAVVARQGERESELELRLADLERQLADADERAEAARLPLPDSAEQHVVTSFDELDEGQLAALVGEETAKVLSAARNAAAGIVANAERTASQMRAKADRDAERLAAEADARFEQAAREADAEAARRLNEADTAIGLAHAEAAQQALDMRAAAEASVADIQLAAQQRFEEATSEAAALVDQARADAKALVERAGADGQALVAEAQAVRARMLEDLLRRRKLLRRQVEQLHAGRERLAASFGVVHEAMAGIDAELDSVLAEARVAAEAAAARADATTDAATDELQALAEQARQAAGLDRPDAADNPEPSDPSDPSEPPEAPGAAPVEGGPALDAPDGAVAGAAANGSEPTGPSKDDDAASSLFSRLKADPTIDDAGEADGGDEDASRASATEVTEPADEAMPDTADETTEPTAARPAVNESYEGVTLVSRPPTRSDGADGSGLAADEGEVAADSGSDPSTGDGPVVTDEVRDQRDALLDDLTRAVVRRLKRLLTDEQNDLLDTIRRQRPLPQLDELLAPEAEHERRYAESALPALRNASSAGQELPAALDADRRTGPKAAITAARRRGAAASAHTSPGGGEVSVVDVAAVLAVEVVGPLRARLEGCMTSGDADTLRATTSGPGGSGPASTKAKRSASADALADEVRLIYREVRNRKVDRAAAVAVRDAFARGLGAVPDAERAGVVTALLAGLPPT